MVVHFAYPTQGCSHHIPLRSQRTTLQRHTWRRDARRASTTNNKRTAREEGGTRTWKIKAVRSSSPQTNGSTKQNQPELESPAIRVVDQVTASTRMKHYRIEEHNGLSTLNQVFLFILWCNSTLYLVLAWVCLRSTPCLFIHPVVAQMYASIHSKPTPDLNPEILAMYALNVLFRSWIRKVKSTWIRQSKSILLEPYNLRPCPSERSSPQLFFSSKLFRPTLY